METVYGGLEYSKIVDKVEKVEKEEVKEQDIQ